MSTNHFDADKYKLGQQQQWDSVASGWKKWWKTFEESAQVISDNLIDLADIQAGHKVLDIATGIGEPAMTAARVVGDQGWVIATDQAPNMLKIASQRAIEMGISNVEFQELDAESLSYPDHHFDAVISRWGLMFLPDLNRTLKSLMNTLKPGGKLATAIWDVPEINPFINLAFETAKDLFEMPPPLPGTPSPFILSGGALQTAMKQIGFVDIEENIHAIKFEFTSAKSYVDFIKDVAAPINIILKDKSSEQATAYWKKLEHNAGDYCALDGRVKMPGVSPCVAGRRPL